MRGKQCAVCKRYEDEVGKIALVKVPIICVETAEENNGSEAIYKDLWLCKDCNLKVAVVNKK